LIIVLFQKTVKLAKTHQPELMSPYTLRKSNSNHVSFTLPYSSTACV